MREIAIEAKSKGEGGAIQSFPGKCKQYDSIAEAIADLKGEPTVLSLINEVVKTHALNALRRKTGAGVLAMFKNASPEKQAKIKAILGLKD